MLLRFIDVIAAVSGWRQRLILFAAGVVSVAALAPFHIWAVLWLTLPVLVLAIDRAQTRDESSTAGPWHQRPTGRAALAGWWFGFGYFFAGLFWIGEAFLVEAEIFAWALPFAITLLPAGLALFFGGAAAVASRFWSRDPSRVLVLAVTLSGAEWLRGHVLSGFPWNLLGYALTSPLPLMQSAAWFGIYGLTFLTVVVFAGPLMLALQDRSAGGALRWRPALALAIVPLAALWIAGTVRASTPPPDPVSGVTLRIVQPSIPQREKWQRQHQRKNFELHLDLSRTASTGARDDLAGITHVVWPEAAMPFAPLSEPAALAAIGELLPAGKFLISGALRLGESDRPGRRQVFNSLLTFGEGGRPLATYDKAHLVPFGEYLPLQSILEATGLQQLARLPGGFAAGPSPRPLMHVPGLPAFAPLICYEALFPGAVIQGRERPGLLVNVTNDGWFGLTTGPHQHLHQARVRAVEEGVPIIRAANNGISAVVDSYGRVLQRLELDLRGVIDTPLPAAIAAPVTARFGDCVFVMFLAAAVAAVVLRRRKRSQ
jgi:apolipoprotein N-acyltransferase